MKKKINDTGMMPVLDKKKAESMFVLFMEAIIGILSPGLQPLEFWMWCVLCVIIGLWYNVKLWGKENAVKVVLWSLVALIPSWLLGAAMLYDTKPLNMIALAIAVFAMFFVCIWSLVLMHKKRFYNVPSVTSFFLFANLIVMIVLLVVQQILTAYGNYGLSAS